MRERLIDELEHFTSEIFPGSAKPTVIVDRGIYGKEKIIELDSSGYGVVTWGKNYKKDAWDEKKIERSFIIQRLKNNSRDDHLLLRELTRASGYIKYGDTELRIQLHPDRTYQPRKKKAILAFLAMSTREINTKAPDQLPVNIKLSTYMDRGYQSFGFFFIFFKKT